MAAGNLIARFEARLDAQNSRLEAQSVQMAFIRFG